MPKWTWWILIAGGWLALLGPDHLLLETLHQLMRRSVSILFSVYE